MCRLIVWAVSAGLLLVTPIKICSAQSQKAQSTSEEFLSKLSEAERKDYDDVRADWDKRRKADPIAFARLQAKLIVQAQMTLGRFGYGTKFTGALDTQTRDALRSYQMDKGIPGTGDLDAITYYSLSGDDEVADKRLVDFGSYRFAWYEDYFTASGAWDKMNSSDLSVRSSELECFKDRALCNELDAIETTILGIPSIAATLTEFKITKWDQYELIAEDKAPDCERDELRINQQEKTVSLISSPTYKSDLCKKTLGKPETITYELVDGTKIFWQRSHQNSNRRAALYQLSPSARTIVEAKEK